MSQSVIPNAPITPVVKEIFSDLGGVEWAKEHIEKLYKKSVVSGDGEGKYLPDNTVTREEFVKMMVLAFDMYSETAKAEFIDVPEDAWYYKYVASAVEKGLITGMGDNLFGTGLQISRQDMAVIAHRAAEAAGKNLTNNEQAIDFADVDVIDDYAAESVKLLSNNGIINGIEGNFRPQDNSTRAQAAVVISRLCDLK